MSKKNDGAPNADKDPRKIAIFENQVIQFRCLYAFLRKRGFKVWPFSEKEPDKPFTDTDFQDDQFRELMNAVHVYLNLQYSSLAIGDDQINQVDDYRTRCRDYFLKSLIEWKPDLVIIDHRLSAPMHSYDGFDLAGLLTDQGIKVPILFLSRSDPSSKVVMDGMQSVKNKDRVAWLPKGYQGQLVLNDDFLCTVVLNKIENLLAYLDSNLFPDYNFISDNRNEKKKKQ